MTPPTFLLVDPAHFEIAYEINPWMRTTTWRSDPEGLRTAARAAFESLAGALRGAGARLEILEGARGAPDLVFPANAAVVLDGRAVLARFRHPERRVEEPIFRDAFEALARRGALTELLELPAGALQEGAGDCIWDAGRGFFWSAHGPRSNLAGARAAPQMLGGEAVLLELATDAFYHLDTCFLPLPGGEIVYHPPAFTPAALRRIRDLVPGALLIEADAAEAGAFCVNAVAFGRTVIMAEAPASLSGRLRARGYELREVDLAPFILSGGAAYCMTLRLDRARETLTAAAAPSARESA